MLPEAPAISAEVLEEVVVSVILTPLGVILQLMVAMVVSAVVVRREALAVVVVATAEEVGVHMGRLAMDLGHGFLA